MASSLAGKVVLITGASSGIGAGTAQHMASLGCRLALVARNLEQLNKVAANCREAGSPDVWVGRHDLSEEKECVSAVQDAVKHFGTVNVLVNNAGVLRRADVTQVSMADIDVCTNLNVKAAVKVLQECLPYLCGEPPGSVVNVSSIAGICAYPGALAYKMSKAGMDQMTRVAALELGPKGVRINSVNPGTIPTEVFHNSGMSQAEIDSYMEQCRHVHPLGRPGRVIEVAKAIAFLASDDASFISGQCLAVDGGRSVSTVSLPYTG